MKSKTFWILAGTAILVFVVLSRDRQPPLQPLPTPTSSVEKAKPPPDLSDIPVSTNYRILSDESMLDIKSSLVIRLTQEIGEEELRRIARDLRRDGRRHFERLFIVYYQPGMTIGAGAWATTHFNPDLEVKIQGLTRDQVAAAITQSDAGARVVGRWIDHILGAVYTLRKRDDSLIMEFSYKDGSSREFSLIRKRVGGRERFVEAGEQSEDYYIIRDNNTLVLCDNLGVIVSLPPSK